MAFLLVVATLVAPILALIIAEHIRERRRRKNPPHPYEEAYEDEAVRLAKVMKDEGRFPKPGWVAETIKKHEEEKKP